MALLGTAVAVGLPSSSARCRHVTRTRARLGRRQIFELLDEVGAVGLGFAFPAAFFALAALGVFDVDTAFAVAK